MTDKKQLKIVMNMFDDFLEAINEILVLLPVLLAVIYLEMKGNEYKVFVNLFFYYILYIFYHHLIGKHINIFRKQIFQ